MDREYLTPSEAAALLGITVSRLAGMAREGQVVPALAVTGFRLYDRSTIEQLVDERRRRADRDPRVKRPPPVLTP